MSDPLVRDLQVGDLALDGGFFTALSRFSLGEMTVDIAAEVFEELYMEPRTRIFVVEVEGRVVATATTFWRRLFIHAGGKVGEIHEVATCKNEQGHGYGVLAVKRCLEYLREKGCYKAILTCDDDNVSYYELQCGFKRHDNGLRFDF